jgi:histo-blood group ABO system transferase
MAARLSIGLLVIATGKYLSFISALWESARQYLLKEHQVTLFLMTDGNPGELPDARRCPVEHEPWPKPALHKYHWVAKWEREFARCDYVFLCDADMRFAASVGNEILGQLVATFHPGFVEQRENLPYCCNPQSLAYMRPREGGRYYAGAFQGGETARYLATAKEMANHIEADERAGVIAQWHDESHWNRYLADHPPSLELSPSYCYPENSVLPFEPRLLALDKDHAAMRS